MHRVGLVPDDLGAFVSYVNATGSLRVDAVFTHLANADEPADDYNVYQLDRFDAVTRELGIPTHAANSAALLAHPRAVAHALVRAGIAIYGIAPGPAVADDARDLRPVLSWRARVSFVKRVPAGARLSYGLRGHVEVDTTVATVPVGYADGVPRRGGACGVDVLVGGRRRRILGTVTMDQFLIDCGDDDVAVGDEVVLIGGQGAEHVSATEWGERTGTIAYEIVCGLSARVPRQYAG
jgi:alanine racemase